MNTNTMSIPPPTTNMLSPPSHSRSESVHSQHSSQQTRISHSIDDNLNDLEMLEEDEDPKTIQPMESVDIFNNQPSPPFPDNFTPDIDNINNFTDIFGGTQEDSDDLEEQTVAMFAKLDQLKLGQHAHTTSLNRSRNSQKMVNNTPETHQRSQSHQNQKPLRKIQSTPAVSAMDNRSHRRPSNEAVSQQLFKSTSQTQGQSKSENVIHEDFKVKVPRNKAKRTTNGQSSGGSDDTEETSPSSTSTQSNNTDKESIYSAQSQRAATEYVLSRFIYTQKFLVCNYVNIILMPLCIIITYKKWIEK